jgi:hypothetical protein
VNTGQERLAQFFIAGCNPTELFHLVEEALHFFTSLVLLSVIGHGLLAIPLGRDDGRHLPLLQVLTNPITIISFVHDYIHQLWHRRALLKEHLKDWCIMAGTTGQLKGDTGLFVKTTGMERGGKPTPRAAQSLGRLSIVFFRAPAAC